MSETLKKDICEIHDLASSIFKIAIADTTLDLVAVTIFGPPSVFVLVCIAVCTARERISRAGAIIHIYVHCRCDVRAIITA